MKVHQSIIKLSKEEVNELLLLISKDNRSNGLVLKLVYVYGRNITDVLRLRKRDIDLKHNAIDFNLKNNVQRSFMIHSSVKADLLEHMDTVNSMGDYLFIDADGGAELDSTNVYSNALNRYLDFFVRSLNNKGVLSWHCPPLVCSDFKVLRGQHLFMDGASLNVIHELYVNSQISSTKNMIMYKDLLRLRFPCDSIDKVFKGFTDLGVFRDGRFMESDIFTVCKGGVDVVVEYDYVLKELNVIGSDNHLLNLDGLDSFLWDNLLHDLDAGNYRFVDDLKIIKN